MREKTPRITSAVALDAMRLAVVFEDGWHAEVDLCGFVADFKSLKPLTDPALFAHVAVEEWGSGLTWDDEGPLSIAATTVYRLACEQAGDAARSFDAWMMQHGFSAAKAADVLGMSRRNIINYRTATRPIPKVVQLACKAVDLGAAAVLAIPPGNDFVWDGVNEDDSPLTKEEMRVGIEAAKRGRGRPRWVGQDADRPARG